SLRRSLDIGSQGAWAIARHNLVRFFLECCTAPTNSDGDLARCKEVMVVLSISDGDRVVDREAKHVQRFAQASSFTDGLRKDHQTAAVEQEHEWKFETPDHIQNLGSRIGRGFHDALARFKFDSAATQFVKERLRWGMTDQPSMTTWKSENCTVFRHDCVDKSKISRRLFQVRKDAASNDDDHDAARTCRHDCGLDLRVQHTISRDGPVVIQRQHAELHDCLRVPALISRTLQQKIISPALNLS